MVKKYALYLFLGIVLTSCEKEEITNNTVAPIETIIAPDNIENTSPEINPDTPINNWIDGQQSASGLLISSENFDFVSLYDNSLAALLFTRKGELPKAELILDFFANRVEFEFETQTGGFYQFRTANGENGSRKWLGDNAWLLIAINHYHEASNTRKYAAMADKLESWMRSLQDEDGGLYGGYNEDGSMIPKVTEGIMTAYNAIPGYDDFHKNILRYLKANRWDPDLQNLNAWPENEAYTNALDILAISQGVFEDFPKQSLLVADQLFLTSQIVTLSGQQITGYCFDEDKDVIWLEGTAQMAVALQTNGNIDRSKELLGEIEKTFIQGFATNDSKGIPYVTNHGTNYGAGLLWDHADLTPALSSTIWYLFGQMNFNPFLLAKEKNIPENDKFWLLQSK
ncbi:hypothetical protein N9954_00615 [Maribacter sp.]|nr:hypothetical protein [Maribacter sp.]